MDFKPEWAEFESWLTDIMAREHVPGVSVGMSIGGNMVYAKGFGSADVAESKAADENTVYGIASISKSFAALALAQLADEGEIDMYAPIVRYLPEFRMKDIRDIESIRVHHCLSHTTGCPPLFRAQGRFSRFSEHIEYIASYDTKMLGRPGEYFSYCNDTFMLAGAIVERVTGQRYSDVIAEKIIGPLGMARTTFHTNVVNEWNNVTSLYNLGEDGKTVEKQPWPNLGTYYVGGGIRSCVPDLLRYGDMYCFGGRLNDGSSLVSRAEILRLRAPVYPIGNGAFYGYGMWATPAYHGVTLVEHSGGQPGVTARWGYVPEKKMVVTVLTNLRGAPADQMIVALVNVGLGLPVSLPRVPRARTVMVEPQQLRLLVGEYRADEGMEQLQATPTPGESSNVIKITLRDGALIGEFDGRKHELRMVSADKAAYLHQGADKTLKWYLRDNQPAWAISTGMQIIRRISDVKDA